MISGVLSGYLSHIPHNLSTLKLMTPSKTYMQHLESLVSQSESRIPTRSSPSSCPRLRLCDCILCAMFPRPARLLSSCLVTRACSFSPGTRKAMATFAAIAFPRAVLIRTAQIVGSFIILNGTINALKVNTLHSPPSPPSPPSAFFRSPLTPSVCSLLLWRWPSTLSCQPPSPPPSKPSNDKTRRGRREEPRLLCLSPLVGLVSVNLFPLFFRSSL